MLVEPVERAATRWVAAKQPVTFQVESVEVTGRTASALVNVVFEGVKHEDRMLLASQDDRSWRIVGKSSRPVDLAANTGPRY
jgi:hypothetical protein